MNLRGGRFKPDTVPEKKKKAEIEQSKNCMRNASSLFDMTNISIEDDDQEEINDDYNDYVRDDFGQYEMAYENLHNMSLNNMNDSVQEEEEESTVKNPSNHEKSKSDGNETDNDVDESLAEDFIGQPLDIIQTTKKNSQCEFGKKMCLEGYYYIVDRDYTKLNINKIQWRCERMRKTTTTA
jgi:hypothetical protein